MIDRKDIIKIYASAIIVYGLMLMTSTIYIWSNGSKAIILVSILWMIIIVPIYLLITKKESTIPFVILNGIIGGFTIAVYFIHIEEYIMINPVLGTGFMGLLCLNSAIINRVKNKRRATAIIGLFGIVVFTIALVLIMTNSQEQAGWVLFSSITVICVNFSVHYWLNEKRVFEMFRVIRHYNMVMFGGVFFVVLAAITDGDSLDLISEIPVQETKKK